VIADDNADCVDYVDRGHVADLSDGDTASTADDNTDEYIVDKVDDTVAAENSYKWDAVVLELKERSAVVAGLVRTDTADRKPD